MNAHATSRTATRTILESADDPDDVQLHDRFEPTFSLKELAELLGVGIQTLYDLRSQDRGPVGFRVGRHLRFRHSEIEAWLHRLEEEDLERHPGSGRR
ncbi:helix-turn-helix transcriptional regulator [Nocardioides sambongensis]|uniref:helix-turn-helix transcriptional regulator n=1 Tax=Nocardioides sambongensis TaxID=2589074 RepID=UPI0015E83D40|nr:helix-turn-helix domain-containing protein [Nocardioides sambongensis]